MIYTTLSLLSILHDITLSIRKYIKIKTKTLDLNQTNKSTISYLKKHFFTEDETKIDDSLNALSSEEPANSSKMLKVLEEAVMNEMRGKRSMGGFSRRSGSLCSKVYCKVTSCEFFKRLQGKTRKASCVNKNCAKYYFSCFI